MRTFLLVSVPLLIHPPRSLGCFCFVGGRLEHGDHGVGDGRGGATAVARAATTRAFAHQY